MGVSGFNWSEQKHVRLLGGDVRVSSIVFGQEVAALAEPPAAETKGIGIGIGSPLRPVHRQERGRVW